MNVISFVLKGALLSSTVWGTNNIGLTSYVGRPMKEPDWVGTPSDFGSPLSPNYESMANPVLKFCSGVHALSAPYEVDACVSQLRDSMLCMEDSGQQSLSVFVWWSRSVMWGGSTISRSVLNADQPMDGIVGLFHGDQDTIDFFLSQSSLWINIVPLVITALIGMFLWFSIWCNLIFFCASSKCRKCWGKCCCNCCCNPRARKDPAHVGAFKYGTQCFFTWLYFLASMSFIIVFGYYMITFTSPYRMNQTACRILAANFGLAFGEMSILDTGTRMMSLMVETGSSRHGVNNMTGNSPILGQPGVGFINQQKYSRMCPVGNIFDEAVYPETLSELEAPSSWMSAVGDAHYTEEGWNQCLSYTPHWADARSSYAKKFSWGRIARDFGTRAYYSIAHNWNGDFRFFYFDEFDGKGHSYVGYPQDCSITDTDGNKSCAFVRTIEYDTSGNINTVTTCKKGQDPTTCHKYQDMDTGDSPEDDFTGEINKPYDFYFRTSDRTKAGLIPDSIGGPLLDNVLTSQYNFYLNQGGFLPQPTVYEELLSKGGVDGPSGLTSIVANYMGSNSVDGSTDLAALEDASTMIGWIRQRCADRDNTAAFTFEDFCRYTMGSESRTALGWARGFCHTVIDPAANSSSIPSLMSEYLSNHTYGRGYEQCVMGDSASSCLFSDPKSLIPGTSNRKDICDVFLSRNISTRSDTDFSVNDFVQYFRASPNAIGTGTTMQVAVVGGVGRFPNNGNYTDVTAQHTYFRDVFDTGTYTSDFADSILKKEKGHIVIPTAGDHPPFVGYGRLSNYIDTLLTKASSQTEVQYQRWPEYFDFLMIIHDAVWVIYDQAMGILPVLPVYKATSESSSTSWSVMIYGSIISTALFSLIWVGMLTLWLVIGCTWCKRKKKSISQKRTGVFYRSICFCIGIGNLVFCLLFAVSSLLIPLIGEVTLFCNLESMTPISLNNNEMPAIVEDIFGHVVKAHPDDKSKYDNSLAECLFHGTDFTEGSIYFNANDIVMDAASELKQNLPGLLEAYDAMGQSITSEQLTNQFAVQWSNADFHYFDDATQTWTPRTNVRDLMSVLELIEPVRDMGITAIQNRLQQVAVATVRGMTSVTSEDGVKFVNVADSPFEPFLSSLVDKDLSVVYLNDGELDLNVTPDAAAIIRSSIISLESAAAAATSSFFETPFWLGRKMDRSPGYEYNGQRPTDGAIAMNADRDTLGDFYATILDDASVTAGAANLKHSDAGSYRIKWLSNAADDTSSMLLNGQVKFDEILDHSTKERVTTKFHQLKAEWDVGYTTIPTWDRSAHDWLETFYNKQLDVDVLDRRICYKSDTEIQGATPRELGIDIKDICVLSLRRPIADVYFEETENPSEFVHEPLWVGRSESVLIPVAGACVKTYYEWLASLQFPVINETGVPEGGEADLQQKIADWHLTACASVDDLTPQYHCIRPMRRLAQLVGNLTSGLQPDLIIAAPQDELDIREVYSTLLPYDYGLNKGRDGRWISPLAPLFIADDVDFSQYVHDYTTTNGQDTGPDFGVPIFGTRTGILFGATGLPYNNWDDLSGFLSYRKCILGPDAKYPINTARQTNDPQYLSELPSLSTTIKSRASSYWRILDFMANTEAIQRYATMTHNYKARSPLTINELGIVEDYFAMRDLLALPTRESALRPNAEIAKDVLDQIDYITNTTAVVNNVAICKDINARSIEAISNLCGGALGLIAMGIWQVWLMSLSFTIFYCFGFKQMHYWIDQHYSADVKSSATAIEPTNKVLSLAYYGQTEELSQYNYDDMTTVDVEHNSCLHLAAYKNYPETIVKILAINKEIIDMRNAAHYTALHVAVYENHLECVRKLLQGGANPNLRDEFGDTPLTAAATHDYINIIDLLLANGANPLSTTRSHAYAADIAEMHGYTVAASHIRSKYSPEEKLKHAEQHRNDKYVSWSSSDLEFDESSASSTSSTSNDSLLNNAMKSKSTEVVKTRGSSDHSDTSHPRLTTSSSHPKVTTSSSHPKVTTSSSHPKVTTSSSHSTDSRRSSRRSSHHREAPSSI